MLVIPQLGQTKSKGLSVGIMSVKFVWSLNVRTFTKCSVILVSLTYFQELSSIILGLLVFLPHCALLLTLSVLFVSVRTQEAVSLLKSSF